MSYFDRIQRCFAKVIGEHHANQMTPDSTMEEVKPWDSLNFVGLIIAVEDEFKIQPKVGSHLHHIFPPLSRAELLHAVHHSDASLDNGLHRGQVWL